MEQSRNAEQNHAQNRIGTWHRTGVQNGMGTQKGTGTAGDGTGKPTNVLQYSVKSNN